ncbi:efflux RND transporter permease subunit [Sandaracinobacteroides saxicola]|uniref:Efflux pump membrane transporter n=1 Tax=Sandaracinobacteroides saxicola TaxID=2759707 RepID=A0A7G5IGL9_9SPHN|nr:multidrug efflux RND transporter permease subunit [Sandaracinobacteroides saxicola]QMW22511.1 multidrug efflux RND transporter permease subunit [Sandaracinobacteroides saxicola]
MKIGHFFIDRPIFAGVLSVLILLVGAIAYLALPVSQYPEIAPPTIQVSAQLPGASAQVIADTVAAPIEQEVNGVENMLYMYSQSTGNGRMALTVTFKPGTNLDTAQVLVQNRVALATPRLPEDVRRFGVVTRKVSPDIMMVVHLVSPDRSRDQIYITNYALLQVRDVLARLDGVGDIQAFGAREYAMRIWLDPQKIATLGLTPGQVVAALRQQNVQVAGGALGAPPLTSPEGFQINLTLQGRLTDPRDFEDIVVATGADGRFTRLKDVARVELGASDYSTNSYLDGQPAVALLLSQRPGANALATADSVLKTLEQLSKDFPKGLEYRVVYNPTQYIRQSVDEVVTTIFEAVILVVVVVLLFLQTWRASLIPILTIPVSLVGTFAVMSALGFSINNLTLFGLVLAIGIVVDDAIVVVENVERNLAEGLSPRDAARKTMDEVGGALISIGLVLAAVFVPTAFLSGITGQFFRQFAITIAVATAISVLNSFTLSPALARLLLKPHAPAHDGRAGPVARFFAGFNRGFERLSDRYAGLVRFSAARTPLFLVAYVVLIGLTVFMLVRTPGGFIPAQDQGYLIAAYQLPPGSSLARTDAVMKRAEAIIASTPGAAYRVSFAGFSGATRTQAPNTGATFIGLKPMEERPGLDAAGIAADLTRRLGAIQDAFIIVLQPPPVPGLGTSGGFSMRIQDRAGLGTAELNRATWTMVGAASQQPALVGVFSPFENGTPQLYVDVDRTRAQILQVPLSELFSTLEVYLGSAYVNDFNLFSRTYRVTAQADQNFRLTRDDIARLTTRSTTGAIVPLGTLVSFRDVTGPDRVPRYNLYPAAEITGNTAPGVSSTRALMTMQAIAAKVLPQGMGFEWTDLSYQETTQGNAALYIFPLCVLLVFLVLAANYESLVLPLVILLIVPMCILAALVGVTLRGIDLNILVQIGLVVLVGLAAKNAILIVEFAKEAEERGADAVEAAVEAARIRLRPILMTSLAFILGTVPLVIASGPGFEMRQALGTAVFSGMIGVTLFGLVFTPLFYIVARRLQARRARGAEPNPA